MMPQQTQQARRPQQPGQTPAQPPTQNPAPPAMGQPPAGVPQGGAPRPASPMAPQQPSGMQSNASSLGGLIGATQANQVAQQNQGQVAQKALLGSGIYGQQPQGTPAQTQDQSWLYPQGAQQPGVQQFTPQLGPSGQSLSQPWQQAAQSQLSSQAKRNYYGESEAPQQAGGSIGGIGDTAASDYAGMQAGYQQQAQVPDAPQPIQAQQSSAAPGMQAQRKNQQRSYYGE